jgi:hypothetical protein
VIAQTGVKVFKDMKESAEVGLWVSYQLFFFKRSHANSLTETARPETDKLIT